MTPMNGTPTTAANPFSDGNYAAEWYRNRFVRGSGPTGRVTSPNTNVMGHHGQILALVEAGQVPVALSPDLEAVAAWDCDGELVRGYVAIRRSTR